MAHSADDTSETTVQHNSLSIGIEIAESGTRLTARHAASGTILRRRLAAPPAPDEAVAALNDLIAEVIRDDATPYAHPDAMGMAVWGDVDSTRGVIRSMPHGEEWDEFPLANRLANHWKIPVFLMPAVAAAGLAEATSGVGQHHRVVLYIHSGRTIASALIEEGAISVGASGPRWKTRALARTARWPTLRLRPERPPRSNRLRAIHCSRDDWAGIRVRREHGSNAARLWWPGGGYDRTPGGAVGRRR